MRDICVHYFVFIFRSVENIISRLTNFEIVFCDFFAAQSVLAICNKLCKCKVFNLHNTKIFFSSYRMSVNVGNFLVQICMLFYKWISTSSFFKKMLKCKNAFLYWYSNPQYLSTVASTQVLDVINLSKWFCPSCHNFWTVYVV